MTVDIASQLYEFPVELKGPTIAFGATHKCKREFVDHWLCFPQAAASEDRTACVDLRWNLWYLTRGG
ncbi:hypothetical protein M405DRAFT_866980 [Rhizopogon salebrosus TDB-379]|nr:hypothetical protein M405DRAFT_866980 [Rhizopogon salebrosus TDB-379]